MTPREKRLDPVTIREKEIGSVAPQKEKAISVHSLRKVFGNFTAVAGIDLEIPIGHIFGFLGPNGSGKTTTIRMLTGTIPPTSGRALVLGEDITHSSYEVRQRIGYMSQKFSLFEDLTVAENLRFYAGIYNLSAAEYADRLEYVLQMADLHGQEQSLARDLSTGLRQRLALGVATIHSPDLLFLDEPTSGVDPLARHQFWELLYELAASGVTLFVTTHYMDEAAHCQELAFISEGRIVAQGSPAELRTAHNGISLDEIFVQIVKARPATS